MKKGLSLLMALSLMLASYGCIVEHRGGEYRGHEENGEHREYREHEENRNGVYQGENQGDNGRDEHGGYEEEH